MSSAAKVLEIARAEIGVKESPSGSNKVKYNTEYYGKEVSGSAYAWCAAFVWWVFKHAGCPELFYGGKKSAYCPAIADYYIANKQTVNKSEGRIGDIVLFDWNHNNSSDHIGIIESKNSDGSYVCIEGNTSVGNNSNGGQVMRRTRHQKDISWICRPKYTEKSSSSSSSGSSSKSSSSDSSSKTSTTTSKSTVDSAKSFSKSLAGAYKVTASSGLNVRSGAGTSKSKLVVIPKGTKVNNYGYYTTVSGVKWMLVQFTYNNKKYTGFCSKEYLAKV